MEKNIADLLKDFTEEPSPGCWENIEQQLPAVNSSGPGNENIPDTSISSSFKGSFLQKSAGFWVKAVAVTVTTATVATLAIMAIVNNDKSEISSDSTPQTPVENILIPKDTLPQNEQHESIPQNTISYKTEKETKQNTKTVIHNETTSNTQNQPELKENTEAVAAKISPVPTESSPSVTKPQEVARKMDNTETPTAPAPSVKPADTPKGVTEDPVIRNRAPEEEEIDYNPPVKLEIPNVITPNGDGINDFFEIRGIEYCDKAHLIIQNRSGKIIFESRQYQNNWGSDAEEGVYYYYFYYTINGIEDASKGTLTVLRR